MHLWELLYSRLVKPYFKQLLKNRRKDLQLRIALKNYARLPIREVQLPQTQTSEIWMAARKVLRMGHPLLLEKSHEVRQFSTKELQRLIRDLHDTMHAEEGAGIAAPQIGVLRRVVIFGVEKNNGRYPDRGEIPETILINPIITPLSDELEEGWEGCLSVPGMRGLVKRHSRVRYQGFDENGEKIHREVDGFHARVVQHECDHLDGILYPMRIGDMREFGFKEELKDKIGC